jgi:ferredoxin
MIEVRINKDCQAWGQCVFDSPEVFGLEDGERVKWRYVVEDSKLLSVKQAERNCPNRAISVVENYEG